ncbi:hypothetical protein [Microcella humidisoli]|uniref:DUF4190 domain-containing protein n=1 Tax=Microcella humidisoli TaxID=2963406 RepID=A0ABY5FT12_9MICO|nr:hypothetical protein [Microcella humidisoli]UTT61425.1 hypothetical protein NNL39_06935 [Microcella humidisoli]
MSDVQPESAPASAAPPAEHLVTPPSPVAPEAALPEAIDAGLALPAPPAPPRARVNALAVAALILAALFSPLAALFGHLAAGQIGRSQGRERGAVIAWIAVGLGYLWLVAAIVAGVAVWLVIGA